MLNNINNYILLILINTMGRGAHAAHAAYNGSGTQGISVTNEINKNEDTHSVFITQNDTSKQILHGHNISEMTCSGKTENITSETYKIFTPNENVDMLGDIYLNFEMNSEITNFIFDNTSPGGGNIDLINDVTQESLSKSFSIGGEDYNSMNVDYSNNSLPTVSSSSSDVSYIHKIINITYNDVKYEIVVGKGAQKNIAIRQLASTYWNSWNLANYSEIIDIIMITVNGYDFLIFGGKPKNTNPPTHPYTTLKLDDSSGINISISPFMINNIFPSGELSIVTKLLYENGKLFISGFRDHTNEVLRASESYFHTYDAKFQTTFIVENLGVTGGLLYGIRQGVTFTPGRATASKRLENYNYKDCILSSSIKYDYTNYAYISGSKEKVLLALSPDNQNNNKIIRSYDNGLNWEDVNFYDTSDNYYPLSNLYQKNEMLVHEQLNKIGIVLGDTLASYTLGHFKTFIKDTFGYIKNDIKLINKIDRVEYLDSVTIENIIVANTISSEQLIEGDNDHLEYNLTDYLDIRIDGTPPINDYEHIWVNFKLSSLRNIWNIGKNIRMTSKKFFYKFMGIEIINQGSGYTTSPTLTITPSGGGESPQVECIITGDFVGLLYIVSNGTGVYDGTETVTISGGGGSGATARIIFSEETYDFRRYLTFAEFKSNIANVIGVSLDKLTITIVNTLGNTIRYRGGQDSVYDQRSVSELGLLQINKVQVSFEPSTGQLPSLTNLIRFSGKVSNAENKPIDERLDDKFNIYLVIEPNTLTVGNLKTRLATLYGGSSSDYLICKKDSNSDHEYQDSQFFLTAFPQTPGIIDVVPPTTIIDTYTNNNVEIRFAQTHPIISLSDPYIIFVSIPLFYGSTNIRKTVSLFAESGRQAVEVGISQKGSGYDGSETVTFAPSDPNGTAATFTITVNHNTGELDYVYVDDAGSGYNGTETATITPSDPNGTPATLLVNFTLVPITLLQLKNKIKTLMYPIYTGVEAYAGGQGYDYQFTLTKGGNHTPQTVPGDNLYDTSTYSTDSDRINTLGIESGDILYFYIIETIKTVYAGPNFVATNGDEVNVSLGTDPLYSENIISKLGVMDDLKYYIPNVNILVNNDKGLWVAAGTPSNNLRDYVVSGNFSDGSGGYVTGEEGSLKRPNLTLFVSNNDGYNWHPVKFSVIEDSRQDVLYKDAAVLHYDDPKYRIEYVSGYVSNSRGDIRITFNIYDTSITPPGGVSLPSGLPGRLVTAGILDIDHYKICPDVISNYNLKAIKMKDIIIDFDQNAFLLDCPLVHATSIYHEYDIYTFYATNPYLWVDPASQPSPANTSFTVETVNSNILYAYNNKLKLKGYISQITTGVTILDFSPPNYKVLDSYLIGISETIYQTEKRFNILKKYSIDETGEIIKINGEENISESLDCKLYLATNSINKAVLLKTKSTGQSSNITEIYTYEDTNFNFRLVSTLQYACESVKFLENVWMISGNQKLLISYDTIHWREIQISKTINEIFSNSNRYHESIFTGPVIDDNGEMSFKPKISTNDIDKYKGLSLFHDLSIRGGIKVNVDEELIADRTNYIITNYSSTGLGVTKDEGIIYEPNDIIKTSNRYIICGNNTGLGTNNKTISLMESWNEASDGQRNNYDDITFIASKSLYTDHSTITDDFMSNFNMERFYKDTNIPNDNLYCSGSYTNNSGTYGVLAIRSIPDNAELGFSRIQGQYYWKLLYAPSLADVPSQDYDIRPGYTLPWENTVFEKINDVVFDDGLVVIVGKGKNEVNLCYTEISYPRLFGIYYSNITENDKNIKIELKLNFDEIHTVCFFSGYWFVGGRPKYNGNSIPTDNYCIAYTDDIKKGWTYKDFPLDGITSSLYEVNNMEVIEINNKTSILTNISYIKEKNSVQNLAMAVLFIDIDNNGNVSFNNRTEFDAPGIQETVETTRSWNGFSLAVPGFNREKWINRPFTIEINGIDRMVISSIYSPNSEDMYYIDYNSSKGFILIKYRDTYIPNIDNSETGVYPKFIKHIKLGTETLSNKTRGHCYNISTVTDENFISGLNSARYVAVGKGTLSPIFYSYDFENWMNADVGNIFDIVFDVGHKHGLWIAVGEGNYNIAISKDGKSWTGVDSKWGNQNLINTAYDSTLNSLSFSSETKITDVLPYIPNLKGIFLRNLSLLRIFSKIEYHIGTQIWQTLTFDDIKAMLDTEFGSGEYKNLSKNCSIINKNGSTRFTMWIPGFTKTLNSKLETFSNISESGSFPNGLLKDQKLSIKIYYNKLDNLTGQELISSDMNNNVFDSLMNNTLIPTDRNTNYYIDSFIADNYGFQLGDTYRNVNGHFKLNYSTEIKNLRLYSKNFELDDTEINEFNKGVKQTSKITQSLYFDANNTKNLILDLDSFDLYASHIIVSGWLTSEVYIKNIDLELNGYSYQKTTDPSVIDFSTKSYLGLNYNKFIFNGIDKEDGIGSLVIPLASTAYSGSSVPLDRYNSIRLKIVFNTIAGPYSYINVTCVGTTTISYNNSTANIDLY